MRENAKASAVASAAVLVGTAACLCGAALAGVFVWRQYGKPKTQAELSQAAARLTSQQQERERSLREAVGPVASKIKVSAGAAVTESESLASFAAGLKENRATRATPKSA